MNFEKATLRKATVSTLPLWAEAQYGHSRGPSRLDGVPEENHVREIEPSSSSGAGSAGAGAGAVATSSLPSQKAIPGYITSGSSSSAPGSVRSIGEVGVRQQQDWSMFATMSSVSTISERSARFKGGPRGMRGTLASNRSLESSSSSLKGPPPAAATQPPSKFPGGIKLEDIFKKKSAGPAEVIVDMEGIQPNTDSNYSSGVSCTCNCPLHGRSGSGSGSGFGLSQLTQRAGRMTTTSKRRSIKMTMDTMRGYPTGHCVSTAPPAHTSWDEKDEDGDDASIAPLTLIQSTAKNTAFNLEAMKGFFNSPLFSNFLKSLTVMAAVSLFAIALDAIVILLKAPNHDSDLSYDNAALILVVILSILTVLYSCFTIFLESRRPPEGLDTSNSKPLTVIFSEIIACIVWAQVLSITIYIYIWTYGCTAAGQHHLERWNMNRSDQRLNVRLCRRQGAMVGLELLLVMLLIFNFYTHLAQNFKFIRAVS